MYVCLERRKGGGKLHPKTENPNPFILFHSLHQNRTKLCITTNFMPKLIFF